MPHYIVRNIVWLKTADWYFLTAFSYLGLGSRRLSCFAIWYHVNYLHQYYISCNSIMAGLKLYILCTNQTNSTFSKTKISNSTNTSHTTTYALHTPPTYNTHTNKKILPVPLIVLKIVNFYHTGQLVLIVVLKLRYQLLGMLIVELVINYRMRSGWRGMWMVPFCSRRL